MNRRPPLSPQLFSFRLMSLKTVFKWHLWLGLISGVCMFLVGMTGAVAVFIEEIDWLVTPGLRVTTPAGATPAPAGAVIAAVRAAHPDGRITTLRLSERPSFAHSATVQLARPQRGSLQVFVHPVTAEITGSRGLSGGYTSSVRNFIRQSHVRLLMGLWGRVFVGVLGVVLVLSCITGLWVYRGWIKKMFRLHLTGGWRQRPAWAELHKFIGVWSLVFNVVIGATGAVLGLENLSGQINRHWLQPSAEERAAVAAAAKPAAAKPVFAEGEPLDVDALLARAAAEFPDLAVRTIDFPARAATPVNLRGDVPSLLMMQSHVRRASSLALDPVSGAVITKRDGRDATGWQRLYFTFDPLHFGYFGGMLTKVIWFILGLTPGVLAVTGTVMWWRRRTRVAAPAKAAAATAETTPTARSGRAWAITLIVALGLAAAYAVVARDLGTTFTHKFAEHWLVKPVALMAAFFPVTALLVWALLRFGDRPGLYYTTWVGLAAWGVFLSGLFQG